MAEMTPTEFYRQRMAEELGYEPADHQLDAKVGNRFSDLAKEMCEPVGMDSDQEFAYLFDEEDLQLSWRELWRTWFSA